MSLSNSVRERKLYLSLMAVNSRFSQSFIGITVLERPNLLLFFSKSIGTT